MREIRAAIEGERFEAYAGEFTAMKEAGAAR
jgi:queuine/archaeosine tRNA-ribosyltransferase